MPVFAALVPPTGFLMYHLNGYITTAFKKMKTRIAMTLVAMVTYHVQASGIYQCRDAKGHMVFSQFRCGTDASQVNVKVRQPTNAEVQDAKARLVEEDRIVDAAVNRERKARKFQEQEDRLRRRELRRLDRWHYKKIP